ncbi:MAG: CotH kinase family protein [Pirellulaceae bacterium]|nr:CotH kinase family protein [Pirellulaceae bacterium]
MSSVFNRKFRRFDLERLESRTMLAGDVVINEFMASNRGTLEDEDQETPDWVELHNVSAEPINLGGWHLTDDQTELTKWQLPQDTILSPDEYRLFFASGKDRRDPTANLHTNFKLSKSGELIALVRPDGTTIQDSSSYPVQTADISYGRGASGMQTYVDAESVYQLSVPSNGSADGLQNGSPSWTQAGFDSSAWSEGRAGFGFDADQTEGTVVTPFTVSHVGFDGTFSGSSSHLINQQSPYLTPLPISAATSHSAVFENDGGWLSSSPGTLQFSLLFPATFDHLLLWNYSFFDTIQNRDVQQNQGTKEFAVSFSQNGDDFTDEQFFTTAEPVLGERVPLEQFSVGEQTARFIRLRQVSSHGAFYGLGEVSLSRGKLLNPDLAYDADVITTNLTSSMYEVDQSSVYLRTSFDAPAFDSITNATLRMKYDDGFVAYLNGTEVARTNAPLQTDWDASATNTNPDPSALEFAEFDIPDTKEAFRESGNVLAIHGLNSPDDGSDFLIHPELIAVGADPVTFGFLGSPTPGESNSLRGGGLVTFSRAGGILTEDVTVSLSIANDIDTIRYTTDGTEPTVNSTLYDGSITVRQTTQIKARSFTSLGVGGPVQREAFLKMADDLKQFDSNLPIFVIDTFNKTPGSGRDRSSFSAVFDISPTTGRSSVNSDPQYLGESGIRQRGRSSAGFAKKQYKFETWDAAGNDAEFPLLGLPSESDWVLNGPYTDKSLMRNVVTFKWWEDLGYYSPRTKYVELFLNTDGDSEISFDDDYLGIYVLVESIKIGPNRIDIQSPEATTNKEEITGGYVIEVGNPGPFTTRGSGRSIGYQYEDPAFGDLNAAQKSWIKSYIEEFETALYSPDFIHPETGKHYSEYIDVASFVDYRAMREFTRDFDGGSTYIWIDRGGKLTQGPMWDMNWALGNVNYAEPSTVQRCGCDIEGWNYSYTTATIPPWPAWSVRLQQDPDHWQLIVDRWHELRQTVLQDDNFLADIDAKYQLLTAEAAGRNFERWNTLGRNTHISPPGFQNRDTYEKEVDYLGDWLVQHAAWLDEQFVPAPRLDQPNGVIASGTSLAMESDLAPAGQILVAAGASARLKPVEDDALGNRWTAVDFQPDATWIAATTGVGFDNSEGYNSIIETDVQSKMRRIRSALLRIDFNLAQDPTSLQALLLNMRYDDGFVAYLNGTEVARSASVRNPNLGEARANAHEAYDFETFDISDFANLLQTGHNVLAIHGINTSTGSSDFLILPELVAVPQDEQPRRLPIYFTTDGSDPRLAGGAMNPNANLYTTPLTINSETTVQARVLQDEVWSAVESRNYLVDVVPASSTNLRISEVHYNPADADLTVGELDLDNNEYEFIELVNIGQKGINLGNVQLSEVDVNGTAEGIEFKFEQQSLAPGQRIVIVENQSAFTSRYENDIRIAGQYNGRLADDGEQITLLAADGSVLQSFTYDDSVAWPALADGLGASLQAISTNGDYNNPANWRASAPIGGTPGEAKFEAGDSNLDRVFDSSDLVQIFQQGKYESATELASWTDGDWNGDARFDSRDLVFAFQRGSYSSAVIPTLSSSLLNDIAGANRKETNHP